MAIATLLQSVEFFYLSLFIYLFLCFAMGFVACVMVGWDFGGGGGFLVVLCRNFGFYSGGELWVYGVEYEDIVMTRESDTNIY